MDIGLKIHRNRTGKTSMSRKSWGSILCALAFAFCLSGLAIGQEVTGTIVGNVKDASGSVVPGATVTIIDPSKGDLVVRTITTNEDGEFSAPNLAVSTYRVSVEAANFKKSINNEIKIEIGQRRSVDVVLEAGRIDEVVTVDADPLAVELSTPTAGTTINGDQVRELSLNNRNFVQLVALAPGVTNDLSDQVYVGTTNPEGQANTINISVNGARSSQNTFTVDGADITDRGSNITIQAYPSVDSIGEFKVLRSLYPAESGRSGGGQVNIITRSGTEDFHGSAFEFVRNEVFNANNFLSNRITTAPFGRDDNGKVKRAPFRYNNFGWTLGGPVYFLRFGDGEGGGAFKRYDKTFFFFSQEFRVDRRYTAPISASVPDANLRNGIFPVDVCINPRPSGTCSGANILTAGTALPGNRLSPVALSYLNGVYRQLPLPNTSTRYELLSQLRNESDFQQEIIKIDHSFSDTLSAYYRYQQDSIPTLDGNSLFSNGLGLPGVSTTETESPGKAHTAQVTWAARPNFIVEGRYNYSYGAILSQNIGLLSLDNFVAPANLPFANERDRNPSIGTTIATAVNGFTSLTGFGPYDNFSNKSNYYGGVTWIIGNHTTKYGAMYSLYRKNENALAGNNEGLYSAFDATLPASVGTGAGQSLPTGFTLAQVQNLQRWANFLVGNVNTFSQASFDYTADLRQKTFEAFAQDEWRFRPNLTLYYGVRYSFFGSPIDKNGRLTNFVPELFDPSQRPQVTGNGNRISGVPGVATGNWCNGIIVNTQNFITGPANFNCTPTPSPWGEHVVDVPKNDFAPRVGLAWDPFGKGETSVRTGYGIYHEQILNGIFLQNIGTNVPYQQTASVSNTTLDNPAGAAGITAAVPGLRAVQSDWKTPYMQHWSLDLQHQLTRNTVFTVGYYGSRGTNLIGVTELNEVGEGVALSSDCAVGNAYYAQNPALVDCQPAGYAFRNSATVTNNPNGTNTDLLILDQIRPYRGWRSIAIIQPRYNSTYHSLQVYGQHRFSGSSQLNLAYTWSKNLTDAQTDRSSAPQNSYDVKGEYGRAALDRRHVMTFNYVYELPWFDKQEGFVGKLLGGMQFSGIATYQTGLPFTATTSNLDYAGLGLINANPTARPNQVCNPNEDAPNLREQWFNTACFTANPPTTGAGSTGFQNTPGTAGRGTIQGPSTKRVDFTLSKNLRFGESMRLQLRWETFNVFNWTNFRALQTNVTSGTYGQVTSVRDPRTMQFGAKFSF